MRKMNGNKTRLKFIYKKKKREVKKKPEIGGFR